MAVCYDLHIKDCDQPYAGRFKTMAEAVKDMKKQVRRKCNIAPELEALAREDLPAPKYRASVYKYLKTFFYTDKYPSCDMIDYSDYADDVRAVDDEELLFDEPCDDFSDYDGDLGFVFFANENGFHFELLRTRNNRIPFYYFYRTEDQAMFTFETMERSRPAVYARIFRSEGELPAKLTGSFTTVILLSILLNTGKRHPVQIKNRRNDDDCLAGKINTILQSKTNESLVLPANIKLSERTIERYLKSINKFGYEVKNSEGQFYIPPFICIRDVEQIVGAIVESSVDENQKRRLIQKVEWASGCYRFAEDCLEETAMPMPAHKDWKAGDYSLIIYDLLRLCGRPMPVTSTKKESIQSAIKKYYGVEIGRVAISNSIRAMMVMELPVEEQNGKYCFDTSETLTAAELDAVKACIAQSDRLDSADKERLINKLDEKFPIGKY